MNTHLNMINKSLVVVVLILLAASCTDNESNYSNMLIGSWLVITENQSKAIYLKEIYTFDADKSFTINYELTKNNTTNNYIVSGKYSLDGNILEYEALDSNSPAVPIGTTDWNEILTLDEDISVTKSSKGVVVTSERIK